MAQNVNVTKGPLSGDERRQLVQRFLQVHVLEHSKHILDFAGIINGVRQLATAGMGQNLASLLFGIEGRGSRTNDTDLIEGCEAKACTSDDTKSGLGQWKFNNFRDATQMQRYLNAPIISLTHIHTVMTPVDDGQGGQTTEPRKVVDVFAISGHDPAVRRMCRDWQNDPRCACGCLSLLAPKEDNVARTGVGTLAMPLASRTMENAAGQMEVIVDRAEEIRAAAEVLAEQGVRALSRYQKAHILSTYTPNPKRAAKAKASKATKTARTAKTTKPATGKKAPKGK